MGRFLVLVVSQGPLLVCGSVGKEFACSAGNPGSVPGQEDPLRRAWQPTLEELGRLQSLGLQRVGYD